MQKVKKCVIPAAWMGTRFLPATKALPKEMFPIIDKPVMQMLVEEAISAWCTDIIIVTGRSKRAIEDHFDSNFEQISPNIYKTLNSSYFMGRYIYKDDIFRFEDSSENEIKIALDDFLKLSNNRFDEIIFYTLKENQQLKHLQIFKETNTFSKI